MKKIITLTIILLIIFNINIFAQTTNIKGIIKDIDNNMPLEDVVVSIEQSNSHSHSDAKGNFSFITLKAGT